MVVPHTSMAKTSADNHLYLLVGDMRFISGVPSGEYDSIVYPAARAGSAQLAASILLVRLLVKKKGRVRRVAPRLLAGVQGGHTIRLAQADGVVEDGALVGGQ